MSTERTKLLEGNLILLPDSKLSVWRLRWSLKREIQDNFWYIQQYTRKKYIYSYFTSSYCEVWSQKQQIGTILFYISDLYTVFVFWSNVEFNDHLYGYLSVSCITLQTCTLENIIFLKVLFINLCVNVLIRNKIICAYVNT